MDVFRSIAKGAAIAVAAAAALVTACGVSAQQPPGGERPAVDWFVADRFRLFSETQEARARADELMQVLGGPPQPLHGHHDDFVRLLSGEGAAPLRASHYDAIRPRGSGRYKGSYLYPQAYRIVARLADPRYAARRCRWRIGALAAPDQPCGQPTMLSAGPGRQTETGYRVQTPLFVSLDGAPEYEAALIEFADRLVVVLGDSFVSGEGNPDVPSVIDNEVRAPFRHADWTVRLGPEQYQPAQWWDEPCHRTLLSWPVLATLTRAARVRREAVTLVHLGCSAATVGNIIKRGQRDLPGSGGDEPKLETQLAQLQTLLAAEPAGGQRRPDQILLSIGGNDIGFAGVIKTLLLPPDYRTGPIGAAVIGAMGGAVCPYRDSGPELKPLCFLKSSAQERLEENLPEAYKSLRESLARLGLGPVHHFPYPNPIVGENGVPCDIEGPRDPQSVHRMGGFEAAMGLVWGPVQGRAYTWNFGLRHRPEADIFEGRELFEGAGCDLKPETRDREICQALWVHYRLNETVLAQAQHGWNVVRGHLGAIFGHGLCRRDASFPLGQPRLVGGRWLDDWRPGNHQAYDLANPRWFRTTNDSAITQYGGPKFYYHGTVHPTLSAHLAYAEAALREALH